MNIIKIHNVTGHIATVHGLEVNTGKQYLSPYDKITTMVIMNEDEINNPNSIHKMKGYEISVLFIPTKFRYTFLDTEIGKLVQPNLSKNHNITYY
jgi:hypothetical protein